MPGAIGKSKPSDSVLLMSSGKTGQLSGCTLPSTVLS